MKLRVLGLSMVSILWAACADAGDRDDPARAAEERALRAQVEQMDVQLRDLANRLHSLEAARPDDTAGRDALRTRIHDLDRDQELLEGRLHELEQQDGKPPAAATPSPEAAAMQRPAVPVPMDAPPPAPPPPPRPALRQAADPAPYLKAAGDRVGMFFYRPYRWLPVGTSQLVVYTSYDEAYLLDLAGACPTLLTTPKIDVENFSTKVFAGRDAVVADGVRCPVVAIRELYVNRLP